MPAQVSEETGEPAANEGENCAAECSAVLETERPPWIYHHNQKGSSLMKQFTYTITDPVGIHARPAGLLAKAAKALDSTVTITKAGGKAAAATKLMAVMGLGVKTGETITFTIEGGNEEASAAAMEQFCKDNM